MTHEISYSLFDIKAILAFGLFKIIFESYGLAPGGDDSFKFLAYRLSMGSIPEVSLKRLHPRKAAGAIPTRENTVSCCNDSKGEV
ncbi:3298_t:CDS:2 [Ambispora leptoticha]|uniref:3298_t:CDS:1 n=1 Tax=Ambispora leptoticha TaxID=144679 RepID=A0A9N9DXR1_9GLOM|nr:3298_t:CDS:2 [Ambispora leptoticha]